MKNLIYILLILSTILLDSCCKKITSVTHTIHDTTSIVVRDRIVDTFIDRDTITNTIEIGCDSLNKPFVKGTGVKLGKRSNLYTSYNGQGLINILSDCKELYIQLRSKDSIIRKQTIELKEKNVVLILKPTFWDYLKMIGLHILYIAGVIVAYELTRKLIEKFY